MTASEPDNRRDVPTSLTEHLVHRFLTRPVDEAARARAVWHWLDWMGCVAVASASPVAQALRNWRLPGRSSEAARWPSLVGMACSDVQAVYLEAGLANVEEMDDMHREAILHPGPVVLPVVAHLARHQGLTLGQALDAVVVGYEAAIRVGRSLGTDHYRKWHNTATAGVFGAAAAAAHALNLTPEATVWALGNAGTQAAGLWQVRLEPVMSKQLHTGHAAWSGLCAATLAAAGFNGPRHILEGEKGFYAAMCTDAQPERLLSDEDGWLIHGTSFKPWPSCRHTHAAIDAALELRSRLGDVVHQVQSIEIRTYGDALSMCDDPAPATRTQAKFSLQYAVSAALHHGPLQPGHFDSPALANPRVRQLSGRCVLVPDDGFDRNYPAHYGAEVRLVGCAANASTCRIRDAWGDPPRPLSRDARLNKVSQLMAYGGVSEARIESVLSLVPRVLADARQPRQVPVPPSWLTPLL